MESKKEREEELSSSLAHIATARQSTLSVLVDYPRLLEFDSKSMWTFLRALKTYCGEVNARYKQRGSSSTDEPVRPMILKLCVDAEYITSFIDLGCMPDVESYDDLDEKILLQHCESKAEESKEVITLANLNSIVEKELKMKYYDKSATSRITTFLCDYGHTSFGP